MFELRLNKYIIVLVYIFFIVVNTITFGSYVNLFITLPQILCVLSAIFKRKIEKAIFYNFIFFITSISTNAMLAFKVFGRVEFLPNYGYGALKLIGPIRWTYAISIILLVLSLYQKRALNKDIFLYDVYRVLRFLAISGVLLGLAGLTLDSNYSFEQFVSYLIYSGIGIVNILLLLYNYNHSLKRIYFENAIYLLEASALAPIIPYFFFNIKSFYGGVESVFLPDLFGLAPLLFLAIFFIKKDILLIVSLISIIYLSLISTGGKGFFTLAAVIIAFIYYLFFHFNKSNFKNIRLYRGIIITICFFMSTLSFSAGDLAANKFAQFTSLFSGSLDSIARSPYIRIAETFNILYEAIKNPIYLLFGKGYGGYFTDSLGLFVGIDLTNGAFSDEQIAKGVFTTAHDTFATVPLFNGIVGLYLLMKLCIKGGLKVRYNFLYLTVIPWLFLMFYFNTQFAATGIFFLYAAEYRNNNVIHQKQL